MTASVSPAPVAPTRGGRRRPSGLVAALVVLLAAGIAVPLAAVLIRAVTGYNGEPSALGTLADPANLRVLGNTVLLGVLVVLFATIMAAPLAFLMSWTRMREHRWIDVLLMVPFMTPPYVAALAWLDFTRVNGLADQWLGHVLGGALRAAVNSVPGMAVVMASEIFTFLYLLLRTALDAIPASSDEAARVAGASPWQRLIRILAPLASRTFLLGALIVFIRAAGEFGTPVTIGNQIGFPVLVSEIYGSVTLAPLDFPRAAALSSVLLGLGALVWGLQQVAARGPVRHGVRASRRTTVRLGGLAVVGGVWLGVVALVSVLIPYVSVVLGAMTILRSQPLSLQNLTFDYFGIVLQPGGGLEALGHSAAIAAVAATLSAVLGTAAALAIASRRRGSRWVDVLAILPDTVPAIVFAIGLIFFWNAPWLPATPYGTPAMLILGYTLLFLPMAVQNVRASRDALDDRFAEAAAIAGAGPAATFARIALPLLLPGIAAGWMLAFLVGVREVVLSSLLRPASFDLLSPWILSEFDQGHRPEAMAMTLIGVGGSTAVLVAVEALRARQARRRLA